MNRTKLSVLIVVIAIALLGGLAIANNSNEDSSKTASTLKVGNIKTELPKQEVEGATTTVSTETTSTNNSTSKKSAAKVATAVAAKTSTPEIAPVAPATPAQPPTPSNTGEETNPDAFDPLTDVIYVPVGGNSASYTITTENAEAFLWGAYNQGIGISDDESLVKPGFLMFIVIEGIVDETVPYISSTITFHIHARATATPGLSYDSDPNMRLGLMGANPLTYNPEFFVPLMVTVVEAN